MKVYSEQRDFIHDMDCMFTNMLFSRSIYSLSKKCIESIQTINGNQTLLNI